MNEYTRMIAEARKSGLSTEQALWHSLNAVERLLDQMDTLKWKFLAIQQESLRDFYSKDTGKDNTENMGV